MKEEKKVGVDLVECRDKKTLHHIAKTLSKTGKRKARSGIQSDEPILRESRGAFVTINKKGQTPGLHRVHRGPGSPLYKTVEKMAGRAAFRDPRFDPVKERELPEFEIEILS